MDITPSIVVDARSFDIDVTENISDFQDAYLARFLNEAMEHGYEVHILTDGSEITQIHTALDTASNAVLEYLGDYVDADILKHAVYTFDEYHLINKDDLVTETTYNAMKGKREPADKNVQIDSAVLAISPRQESDFAPMIGTYQHFMHPNELESINAFEQFEETREQDSGLHHHIVKTASLSASRQLTLILNQAALNSIPQSTLDAITKQIEDNETLQDFFHGHALTVEMGGDKPHESEAKFYLSCYFANLVRLKNSDALSISQESTLDAEQTQLIGKIGDIRGGHDAIEELHAIVIQKLHTSPPNP